MAQLVKTVHSLALASVKTVHGVAIASLKTIGDLDNTGSSFLAQEGFEAVVGYDLGSAWTEGGAGVVGVNEDSIVNPIVGTQSLNITLSTATGHTNLLYTAQNNTYVYFRMRINSWGASNFTVAGIRTSGGSVRASLQFNASRVMRVLNSGGTTNASTDAVEAGVGNEIHVWFEYELGGGANAITRAGWSSDGTKPTLTAGGAKSAVSTDGTGVAQTARLYFGFDGNVDYNVDIDMVRVSATTIGSNPS